jgi:phosphate-selective porin OprO/OprP
LPTSTRTCSGNIQLQNLPNKELMKHHWYSSLLALVVLPATSSATTPTTPKAAELLASNLYASELALGNSNSAATTDGEENPLEFDVFWKDSLNFRTKNKEFKLKIGGRIHHDAAWFSEDLEEKSSDFDFENGTEFRRTRLYFSGAVGKNIDFKIQMDFAADATGADFKDAYTDLKCDNGVALRVGQFNEPFSLGELTSSNYMAFLERATPTGVAAGRNTGAMVHGDCSDESVTYAFGVFKPADDIGTATGSGMYNFTGRVTGLVVDTDDTIVHVGIAASMRKLNGADFDDDSRGPAHLAPKLLNNDGFAADEAMVLGAEVAVIHGPLWVSGEYIMNDIEAMDGLPDATQSGMYVQGGYFFTGEQRGYKRSSGTFSRVKPINPKGGKDGGNGAWEVALRYSMLEFENLRDGGTEFTDELNDITLGLNWYWNNNFRIMFNYTNFDLDSESRTVDAGGSGFMTRLSLAI